MAVGTGAHVTCLGKRSCADLSRGISPDLSYHLRLRHQETCVDVCVLLLPIFYFYNYL